MTIKTWVEQYIRLLRIDRAPRTIESYEMLCRRYILPAIGETDISEVTAIQIDTLLAQIVADGHERTAQMVRTLLAAMFHRAIKYDLIEKNIMERVDLIRHKPRIRGYLEIDQIRTFLHSSSESKYFLAWVLACCLGLRRCEILGLKWGDIDLDRGEIHIRRQRQRINGETVTRELKSETSRSTLPIGPDLVRILSERRSFPDSFVLPGVSQEELRQGLIRDLDKAGIKYVSIHELRHSMAAVAVSEGVDVKVLQMLMRNASMSITSQVYAHVTRNTQVLASQRIQGAIAG